MTLDEVAFEKKVFLLTKAKAKALKSGYVPEPTTISEPGGEPEPTLEPTPEPTSGSTPEPGVQRRTIHLSGNVPPEVWNRLGTKLLPKLRSGSDLEVGVAFSVSVSSNVADSVIQELRQILDDLNLKTSIQVE